MDPLLLLSFMALDAMVRPAMRSLLLVLDSVCLVPTCANPWDDDLNGSLLAILVFLEKAEVSI